MNPFLYATVATPLPPSCFRPSRRIGQGLLALSLSTSAHCAVALEINIASEEALQTLKGMGQKTAALIVEERRRGGQYLSFDDVVDRVNGVGPTRLRRWQKAGLTITASMAPDFKQAEAFVSGKVQVHTNMPVQGRGKAAR